MFNSVTLFWVLFFVRASRTLDAMFTVTLCDPDPLAAMPGPDPPDDCFDFNRLAIRAAKERFWPVVS